MRVADQMHTWEEGKCIVFDDSFEHELWHNGTTSRVILVLDVWHPDLNDAQRSAAVRQFLDATQQQTYHRQRALYLASGSWFVSSAPGGLEIGAR